MLRFSYRRCQELLCMRSHLCTIHTDLFFISRGFITPTQYCRTKMCSGYSCQDLSKKLTPEQYRITQEKGTERAFTGKFYDHHEVGTYTCVVCNVPLFSSQTKYDSGSGWPSFFKALEAQGSVESVERKSDNTHGMVRVEVVCRNCQAHLGHVFDDGPHPTGERFCINSASLGFEPAKE